jgi:hypothetical protein
MKSNFTSLSSYWVLLTAKQSLLLWVFILLLASKAPTWAQQVPAWQQVVPTGTNAFVYSTAADASGNIYVAGSFSGTATFGSTSLTNTNPAYPDAFVAKWSAASNGFVWAQQVAGMGEEQAYKVALSGNSVYLVGHFTGATATLGTIMLTRAGASGNDAYVAKLLDAGASSSFVWAQRMGGSGNDVAYALAVNGPNVYVAGSCQPFNASFGAIVLNTSASIADNDAFVAKLTDNGATASFTWVQPTVGSGNQQASALAVSGSNVYVAGVFNASTLLFGNVSLLNPNAPQSDLFVAKLTDAGNTASVVWGQKAGGSGNDWATCLAVQGASVYVGGGTNGPSISFGNITQTSAGYYDAFVAKITDAGNTSTYTWARQAGSAGFEEIKGIAVNGNSLYVAGFFTSTTLSLGSTTLQNAAVGSSSGTQDVFVAKLQDAGSSATYQWALQGGGSDEDIASALSISSNGTVCAAGSYGNRTRFGSITPPNTSGGFLALLTDNSLVSATHSKTDFSLVLYPNPARARATIQLPPTPGATTASISLLDALGHVVRTTTVALPAAGLHHELDLTGISAGFYGVQVAAGGRSATQRLIVEQ